MSTKRIISTINVILALLIRFSTQHIHNQSDTYQVLNDWSIETNLLDFEDNDSNEQLMAFNPCLVHYCPKGMECLITASNMPSCVCQRQCILYNKRKRRHICGSNGKLYANYCELYRDGCLTDSIIALSDMTVCQHRECSADEYALMKDNLLLFHHHNMEFLQHGTDGQAHRMDYLVSIIFSHYDQNNDGLVEKDELALMWNTMDLHRIANDSNCTLLDMLIYDDTNDDLVLTINEFNDAFRKISDTQTQDPIKPDHEKTPKVHLDMSLVINYLTVHTGDNMEIKCDITGASASMIIWKRFGYDLSQMANETDDYDDASGNEVIQEIKIMNDGGIYIQNVQMKHAGNYSCQASTNGMIVQTHIVAVRSFPMLLVSPEMQSKRPGESVELTCYSVGEFFPFLEWLKNEKPLDAMDDRYKVIGNGTLLRINNLSFYDTGAYTCTSALGHSNVSTLVVQTDPTPISINRDQKLFIFHSNGISIYSSGLCQLVHEVRADDRVPGTDDTICHQYARRCTWGEAVTIDAPDGLIYIAQPMMDRILVLSIAQLIVIEIIPTDGTPMELHHIPMHDQLWIINYNLHRDGTIRADPSKTLQMVPDVRMIHVKHHPIHPETINGDTMNFYVPPIYSNRGHVYDFKYGLVTHHKQRGFFKLDLSTMRYAKYVDLSIYDCVPEHIKFGGLYGFIIISCMEPITHRQTGQLVLDYITSSIISIKADLVGVPFISPDSRYVVTINHRHDSVLLSVQQVTINGLLFVFDVETTLNISDIRFVKSSTSLDYDVYATTDKSEILFLSLDTGKVETITGVGEPSLMTWFNSGRKIKESDLFSSLIASPSKDSMFIISTKTRNITCEIGQLENPTEIVWA